MEQLDIAPAPLTWTSTVTVSPAVAREMRTGTSALPPLPATARARVDAGKQAQHLGARTNSVDPKGRVTEVLLESVPATTSFAGNELLQCGVSEWVAATALTQ